MSSIFLRRVATGRQFQLIQQARRCYSADSLPWNTVVTFVPQQEAWVIERMGKFAGVLKPGLNFLIPLIDRIAYVQSLKEMAIDIPQQSAITSDNVTLHIDGVLYLRVVDPYKASYGVEDPEYAVTQLAQTTMRSEIGKLTLDTVFRERENLNLKIIESLNKASEAWGIDCLRYEIRNMKLPARIQEAMQTQVEADRKKRAAILESEGIRASEINVAEGRKQARILASEAQKQEEINRALGDAEALLKRSHAKAQSVDLIANAVKSGPGQSAVSYVIAEEYIKAFGNLAHHGNTMLIGSDAGNVEQMVAKAMAIYKTVGDGQRKHAEIELNQSDETPSSGNTSQDSQK